MNKWTDEVGARDPALPWSRQDDRALERAGSKIHLAGEEKESIHISSMALGLRSSHSGQQRRPLLSPKVKLFHMIFFFKFYFSLYSIDC